MGRPRKVKAAHIATAAGVSRAAITKSKLVKRNADGSINVGASIKSIEALEISQARKEAALAEIREMERDKMRGEMVNTAEMELAWASVAQTFRDALLSMPERLAPQIASLSDPFQVRDALRKEAYAILGNLPDQIRNSASKG